ncbi:MAG: bifunctional [glutamate--ammonia ligase]-adenylyl-L-tyrosine phosphorylase/[glutamate--ammonia-ligase] adenylyltransferase [Gammaproteobacteria bacterium]|nr:bifunctional [glutamate--ammonia ligase]-adenylyl-L-tyrosine phosphorylase/[glutamate--ammonia-ligase] adenylyltransferase [Pseudomonadales bacterium]MCP5347588.1 bifunctional [glutamate--ammonia ligase]-adenylyl-L-tyrosine phosphorylase/[glutamate--ammonia-ligase] adenylyltransferase [Pseudomonadales bacterium]
MQAAELIPEHLQGIVSRHWERLEEQPGFSPQLAELLTQDLDFRGELLRCWCASDFVAATTLARPELLLQVATRRHETRLDVENRLRRVLEPLLEQDYRGGAELLKRELRRFHRLEYLLILWRDLCGLVPPDEICRQLTELADAALQTSLDVLHAWSCREWGRPLAATIPQQLVVLGMGKLGARELNVSSDIDLIFCFPQAGQVQNDTSEALTNQQFFTRLGQRLIDAIDATTPDGFLFRVDMRLRPYGSEGALVASFDAMEDYYQNQGRDWERYALIKARVVAGDRERGAELLERLKPFVYRRYLDFAMFESLRTMKSQINKQARRGRLAGDIKLGPGGIREVEFTAQALQLVYGGRDKSLRYPSLIRTLDNLVAGSYLPAEVAGELQESYWYLRNLEHKLQAFANQQTQTLPGAVDQQQRIAFAMGHRDWNELLDTLERNRQSVSAHFQEVLGTDEEVEKTRHQGDDWAPFWRQELNEEDALSLLEERGFEDPAASLELIAGFRREKKFLTLPAASRERLNIFMPVLIDAVADSEKPSLCLARVMLLVEAVCRRTSYLILLLENPQALEQLVQYCTASPLIAESLSKYPILLDELLSVLDAPPEKSRLADELQMQLLRIDEENFEEELDCLRYFKQSHHLQVAAAEVSGKMHLMKVSDYLTYIAEVTLDAVLSLSWQYLVEKHGFPVHRDGRYGKPSFGIIGYGKLGGLELSYSSDLDLVFLHEADLEQDTVVSEGQVSLNSRAFYIKLAQRIILLLGTYTMSGKLYEADMRLRPSGESGLLVSTVESFREYQESRAWTWEHQALVRARGVAGNAELLQKFSAVRSEILSHHRDREELAEEVVSMRDRMRRELKSSSTSELERLAFQLKQGQGGIVDIEFLVQYLVLAYAGDHPTLLTYTDNFRILETARECQLLEESEMNTLIAAYLDLRAASHRIALQQLDDLGSATVLEQHQEAVTAIWKRIFGSVTDSSP